MIYFNPSSGKVIQIALYNKESFFKNNFKFLPLLNPPLGYYSASKGQLQFGNNVPALDLLDITNTQTLSYFAQENNNYNFAFIESISVNPIEIYAEVPTYTYSNYVSTFMNNKLKTEGEMKILPVLPFGTSTGITSLTNVSASHLDASQEIFYRLSVFPFVPFFVSTDLTPNNLGGPLFVNSFTISVNDGSPVDIMLKFAGGTGSNNPLNKTTFSLPSDQIAKNTSLDNSRTAKIYDCFVSFTAAKQSITNIYTDFRPNLTYLSTQDFFLQSMSLTIDNQLDFVYSANDGIKKTVLSGPKFIAMKKRTVKGSITFLAASDLSALFAINNAYLQDKPALSNLIMYFSGPYYYPMTNVRIQQFSVSAVGGEASHKHTVNFVALLIPTQSKDNYYKQNEFNINFKVLGMPFDGTVKTLPM